MPTFSASTVMLAHIDIPPKLLGSLVVLVLSLIVWGIVALANSGKKRNQSVPHPNAPFCPRCGIRANWVATQNSWSCIRCMQVVAPPLPPVPPIPPHLQQPAPSAQGPFCSTCGTPGRWIPESSAWGCDRCRALIGPPAA